MGATEIQILCSELVLKMRFAIQATLQPPARLHVARVHALKHLTRCSQSADARFSHRCTRVAVHTLQEPCGVPSHHCPWGNVFCHHGPSRNHCSISHSDAPSMVAPPPIQQSSPILMGLAYSGPMVPFRTAGSRGWVAG